MTKRAGNIALSGPGDLALRGRNMPSAAAAASLYPNEYSERRQRIFVRAPSAPAAHQGVVESAKMAGDGTPGLPLHVAIVLHDPASEGGERGAAAAVAAHLLLDERLAEALVEVVDEQPCPPVGHAHGAAGRGDGAMFIDQFEQADLAGADRPLFAEIHAQGESGHRAYRRLAAGHAHMAGDRGPGVAAVDDEVVALGLAADRLAHGRLQELVALARPQRRAQIGGVILAEAHIERAGA